MAEYPNVSRRRGRCLIEAQGKAVLDVDRPQYLVELRVARILTVRLRIGGIGRDSPHFRLCGRHRGIEPRLGITGHDALLHREQAFHLVDVDVRIARGALDRKSTRLNSSHVAISYAVFCLKKKKKKQYRIAK